MMSRDLRTLLKRLLTGALYYSGIAWAAWAFRFRRRLPVLMYHRVLPSDPPPDSVSAGAIVVTVQTFDRHMRFLSRFFNPVSIDEFTLMLRGERPWRPRSCLVTFDDGWFDNAEHAAPILERYGVPAVVYVATGYLDGSAPFWQERLTRLLTIACAAGEEARGILERVGATHVLGLDPSRAREEIRFAVTRVKSRAPADIASLVEDVERDLEKFGERAAGYGADRFMSWEQARRMAGSGLVAIGSHAHSHVPLTALDAGGVRQELTRSREELRRQLGQETHSFAYPNGDWNAAVADSVRAAGYQTAFTTRAGWAEPGDEPLRLKRINMDQMGTATAPGLLCRLLLWV